MPLSAVTPSYIFPIESIPNLLHLHSKFGESFRSFDVVCEETRKGDDDQQFGVVMLRGIDKARGTELPQGHDLAHLCS